MKHILITPGMSAVILLSSCDKHNLLLREKERVQAEHQQVQQSMRDLDAKFHALGTDSAAEVGAIDRRAAEVRMLNAQIEAQLALISSKCSQGEEMLKELRPRLEAYKSKFIR